MNNVKLNKKDKIRELYKQLSNLSHPSHINFSRIEDLIKKIKTQEVLYDCEKIKEISNYIISTYDFIFTVVLTMMKEKREKMKTDQDIQKNN